MMNYKKFVNGEEVEMTAEEIAEIQNRQKIRELQEKRRPLTASEVIEALMSKLLNTVEVEDVLAARMKSYYPAWEVGKAYSVGNKVQYGDKLYKVIQAHTSQADWTPDIVASLFTVIDETHAGTIDDPIPYDDNMALVNGKYYIQNSHIYLCNRDSINPLYNPLYNLVGHYVELIV